MVEERLQLQGLGVEAPDPGLVEALEPPRGLDPREGVQALGEPQAAIGSVLDRVDQLMGIADAEAGHHQPPGAGVAAAGGIREMEEVVEVAHVHAAVAGLEPHHHGQSLGPALGDGEAAIAALPGEHQDVVRRQHPGDGVGVGGRAGDEEPAALIPGQLGRLAHPLGLGGDQRHRPAGLEGEAAELLLRRRHHVVLRRQRDARWGRRRRLLSGQGLDARIPGGDHRLVALEHLAQRRPAADRMAEGLGDAVAIDEAPVGRPPAVEEQAVLLDDRRAQIARRAGRRHRHPELRGHQLGELAAAVVVEVQAVVGRAPRRRLAGAAAAADGGEIDAQRPRLRATPRTASA